MTATIPLPPLELAHRVGAVADRDDPFGTYDEIGRASKESLLSLLPRDWTFASKRILDFGCGAGRTLRHFAAEAETCEFYGCDIDEPSIAWLKEHLSPPFRVFVNGERPRLDLPSRYFDLVYAISVFTHLTDLWSAWLVELHRILIEDGLLVATFMGEGAAAWITDEPWREDEVGMNVLRPGQSWADGGPTVLHSPWWIRAHWGRAFDVLELVPNGFALDPPEGQGAVLMRKRAVDLTKEELELPEPGEPRELKALRRNVHQLSRELIELRVSHDQLAASWKVEREAREAAERRTAELSASLEQIAHSRSWRLTSPLRSLAWVLRRGRRA
jgi:SAM-dependent methyltransferase